jgi:peptide/nickel transport system substrate-binding protein
MTLLSRSRFIRSIAVAGLLAITSQVAAARAETTVTVGVVNDFAGWNPYADSTAQMYSIWCQVYGCLGTFNALTGDYEPMLAESWETDKADPKIWYFHLRKGLKRQQDGKELTAADVVHSIERTKKDPRTAQVNNVEPIASAEAVDPYTVKLVTVQPTAPLLSYIFDRIIITGKDLFDKNGANADRKTPYGWGPYAVEDVAVGQRMVLRKNPNWPGIKAANPDRLVFTRIREDQARITALINGEVQLIQAIPPHLRQRLEEAPGVKPVSVPSTEPMFLGMNPKFKPWDNPTLRRAVAYAIDRDAIIKTVFQGGAELLDGPVGPGQYGYSPDVQPKYRYDPAKAKQLLAEAGYPNGLDVDMFMSPNRYINDVQSSEAIAAMLTAVGIRTKLNTPDYSIHWPNLRKGLVSFYYMGRGSVNDPSAFLEQYFETGVTPRLSYSNPKLDALLQAERREFDPDKRKGELLQAFDLIQQEAPAVFLWRINSLYGVSDKIAFTPHPDDRLFGTDITVK